MVRTKAFNGMMLFVLMTSVMILVYLVLGLFRPISMTQIETVLLSNETMWSVFISLSSIFISMIIVGIIGTLLAYNIAKKKGRIYQIINGVITLPLILPPTVAGLVLLQSFGKNSWLNMYLFNGSAQIPFHFIAIVFAQVYVTLPYFYQMTLNAFDDVDDSYLEAARVCGADRMVILQRILIPISKKSMFAGLFMSALRGLSEFGATIMFAGNMVGKTQTMTTRIYQLYQSDMDSAFILAGFQLLLFIVPYWLIIKRKSY